MKSEPLFSARLKSPDCNLNPGVIDLKQMEVARFENSPIGSLVPIRGVHDREEFEHFAFVPRSLPRSVELSQATWSVVTEAVHVLGRLDSAGKGFPNPARLTRPAIRREAVSTSALEGTYTTLPQVLESELLEEEPVSRDVDEVLRFIRTAELGFELIKERPLSLHLIKTLHESLMETDPRCPEDERGVFRKRQNFIGPRRASITKSFFVPPPPGDQLLDRLENWIAWIHDASDIPLMVRAAIGHYQFETLHPFFDGNGRIGRLIIVLQFLEAGHLSVPLLEVSPYFEDRRDEYQEALRNVSASGDFDPWVRFFAEGVRVQSVRGLRNIDALISLRDEMIEALRKHNVRGTAIQLAEELIGFPVVAPAQLGRRYNITYQAAQHAIKRLEEFGFLRKVREDTRRQLYVAPRVFEILE